MWHSGSFTVLTRRGCCCHVRCVSTAPCSPMGGGVGMPHIPEADGAQRVNYGLEANSFKTRLCGNQKHNGWQCFLYLKQDTINNNRLVLKTL